VDENAAAVIEAESEADSRPTALGALIVEAGIASEEQVMDAIKEGVRNGEKLGRVAVRQGWATEEQIAELLAKQWQLRYAKAETLSIDPGAIRKLPRADAERLNAVPFSFEADRIVVAVSEPSNDLFEAVNTSIGDSSYVVVTPSALSALLKSRLLPDDGAGTERAQAATDGEVAASETPIAEVARMNAVADVDVEQLLDAIAGATRELEAAAHKVVSLADSLSHAQEELAQRDAQLAAAEAASREATDRLDQLRSDFAERQQIFDALKEKVLDLKETLDVTPEQQ
jgi:hypothetical protein